MRNARHILVVALVAGAIYTDRAIVAVPSEQPVVRLAERWIQRLTVNLCRVLPAARLYHPRRSVVPSAQGRLAPPPQPVGVCHLCFAPFHFRMPPPLA